MSQAQASDSAMFATMKAALRVSGRPANRLANVPVAKMVSRIAGHRCRLLSSRDARATPPAGHTAASTLCEPGNQYANSCAK